MKRDDENVERGPTEGLYRLIGLFELNSQADVTDFTALVAVLTDNDST